MNYDNLLTFFVLDFVFNVFYRVRRFDIECYSF
mgnify:CR=1 FL=1